MLDRPWNVAVAGVGGTGVLTIGAVLAMAAHMDGLSPMVLDMAGLAQKGGAVSIHVRVAPSPADINSVRIAAGGLALQRQRDVFDDVRQVRDASSAYAPMLMANLYSLPPISGFTVRNRSLIPSCDGGSK